jgi:hypothetical protein
LDGCLQRKELAVEPFSRGVGEEAPGCQPSQVYMLRAVQKEKKIRANNIDIIIHLQHIPPVDGNLNRYRRIGSVTLAAQVLIDGLRRR